MNYYLLKKKKKKKKDVKDLIPLHIEFKLFKVFWFLTSKAIQIESGPLKIGEDWAF
jgi:hypothetical protein